MVFDTIMNWKTYENLNPQMARAFDFIEKASICIPETGRYEIDGINLYAIVFKYVPKAMENPRYETHDRYLDIQCLIRGSEYQWYCPRKDVKEKSAYNPEKDVTFYEFNREGTRMHMHAGSFALYFPQDAHLPAMADGSDEECVRIVVKIKC